MCRQCGNFEDEFDISDYLPEYKKNFPENPLFEKVLLENLIIEKRMTQREISANYGFGRSTISDYKKRYKIEAERNGCQGQVPFGYKLLDTSLIKDNREFEVIEKLKELKAQGASYGDLVKWLNKNSIPTKNRCKMWSRTAV